MPDKNTKKSTGENLAVLEQESKGFSGRLNQERAYKILSQGIVLTMEDDLREALSRQKMKADLIPGQSKKEDKTQEVFAENPVFNPFQNLEEAVEEAPEKAKPESLPSQSFVRKIEPEIPQKLEEKEVIQKERVLPEKTEARLEEAYKEAQKPVILKEIIGENIEKIKQNLGQKILDILSKLRNINAEEEPLLQRRKVILEKITLQKKALESFFQKTEAIKIQQVKLEKQEQEAKDSQIKHSLEEQRWQIEEKLKQAQDLQWAQEEEIEKAQMALSKVDNDLKDFSEQKTKLEKEKIEIQKFLENIGFLRQKEEFLNKNQSFLNQKSLLEASYNEALLQKNKQDQELLLIIQEEQKIEKDLKVFENKAQQAVGSQERRKLEQERRELTQKRQLQEKKRWEFEKNQTAVKNNFNLANEKFLKVKQEEENFNQKIAEIEARIDKGIFPQAEKYLKSLAQSKAPEKVSLQEPQQENQEIKKETQKEAVPPVAISQPIPSNKTVFKETLLSREQEQESVEKIRLGAKEREQELVQKQVVQKQVIEGKQAIHAEFKQKQEEENRAKAISKLRQIAEQEQKKAFAGKLKGPLLKEEILRKLTKISLQEEGQRKEFLARINKKTKLLPKQKQKGFEEAVIFHPMIKKTSLFEKIAIRFLIILMIIGVGVGIYFIVLELNKEQENDIPPINDSLSTSTSPADNWPSLYPNGSTTASSTMPLATSTIPLATTTASSTMPLATSTIPLATTTPQATTTPPISLISVSKNNILSYSGNFTALASSTATVINKKISYNTFEQISVLNNDESVFLTALQFFEALGASLPGEIFNNSGTSTVLVYSSKYGNRLGFVLSANSTSSLLIAFRNWENQAESKTVSIFSLMGKKSPATSKIFKNVTYKTVPIRCQAFAVTDFGICYAAYKNYFIWTSAYEQMQRIVDKLP